MKKFISFLAVAALVANVSVASFAKTSPKVAKSQKPAIQKVINKQEVTQKSETKSVKTGGAAPIKAVKSPKSSSSVTPTKPASSVNSASSSSSANSASPASSVKPNVPQTNK